MRGSLQRQQELVIFMAVIVLLFLIYIWVYLVSPLGGMGNELVLNVIYTVFVAYPVWLLWRIQRFYGSSEAPRLVWQDFLIGFGFFLIGEILWAYLNLTQVQVPVPSLADWFYVVGYFFLTSGLLRQYFLIFPNRTNQQLLFAGITILLTFTLSALLSRSVTGAWTTAGFFEFLYPIFDLMLAVIAFHLLHILQKGTLARPFWGFVAMFVADLIYAIMLQSNAYAFLLSQADMSRLFSDIAYNLAYIVFAIGFWGHYANLNFGTEGQP
jgi:hypothetical protein